MVNHGWFWELKINKYPHWGKLTQKYKKKHNKTPVTEEYSKTAKCRSDHN